MAYTPMTLNGYTLPDGLIWTDEFSSPRVIQTTKRTLDGGIVVYHGPLVKGVPITLESTEDSGWVPKSIVDSVQLIAQVAGGIYLLVLRSVSYQVMFRHQDTPAFDAVPIIPVLAPSATDWYRVKIRLMTV